MSLQGKTAVVTGASRGIGREIALKLASEGANLLVNYAGSEARAEEVVKEARALGVDALAWQCNVAKEAEVQEMMKAALEKFGRIDILVNNAGITRDNLLMRLKEADWDEVININLKGVFLCTKAVSRQMMRQGAGKIINLASVVGLSGNPGQANYVAAKAGVIGLTKSSAKELASRGINVNAVAPGFITTDMTDDLPEKLKEDLLKLIPLGKFGQAVDIANLVSFLASDESNYITGQTINVDGGMVMQ